MARLNLTLDSETFSKLARYAKAAKKNHSAAVRGLVQEGIARREALERHRKLAADYAAGRADQTTLLAELEASELELLDE